MVKVTGSDSLPGSIREILLVLYTDVSACWPIWLVSQHAANRAEGRAI
jgi:hypothetical protein